MYRLPYYELIEDTLIPHPGSDYTITYPLNIKISTKNIVIDSVEYKNLFVCVLPKSNTNLSSLCLLQNITYTQDEQLVYFTAINKVKIKKKGTRFC